MCKNLLKKMVLALLLTAAVPTLTAQVHVGDILCEGNAIISPANYPSSGATAIGVVFYVDNTGQHGWAVALQDAGSYKWGPEGTDTPLPNFNSEPRQAIYDLNGYENTRIVRSFGGSSSYPAFYAVDFANGWYIPAIGQLNYLYGNLVEVNSTLKLLGKSSLTWNYWSSTERYSYVAWVLQSNGNVWNCTSGNYTSYKGVSRNVRAARNF